MRKLSSRIAVWACIGCALVAGDLAFCAEGELDIQKRLQQLQEQNELLQKQISQQAELIQTLSRKVSAIENNNPPPTPGLQSSENKSSAPAEPAGPFGSFHLGKVNLSGEGGVGIFRSGAKGLFPNSEFRVDEAKLFVEAPIFKETYFFSEINLFLREGGDYQTLNLGELYLDFENLSRFWNRERMLSLRVGRMDIPFGEEYLLRDAIDNPLISHSLTDFWGVDEGVELYGAIGPLQYVLAVQNGGHAQGRDYTGDKSVAGRVSYDPATWLHLSVSGMRTGDLGVKTDGVSELWVANGFVMPLDPTGQATRFHAELLEGDAQVVLPKGHIKGAGGYLHYNDNAPAINNRNQLYYYYFEGLYHLTKTFYGAMRFSQILAPDGFPLSANTSAWPPPATKDLWRLSLGLGYRPGENLLLKGEYTFDGGRTVSGETRNHENLFAVEAAFKF